MQAYLEHANITVKNPDQTAALMCTLFDWRVRWSGASIDQGYTVHVGGKSSYIALYTNNQVTRQKIGEQSLDRNSIGALNHLAVVVDNLEVAERRALKLGLTPTNFDDYEPGKRFYVLDEQGLEVEIVEYKKSLLYWALSLNK